MHHVAYTVNPLKIANPFRVAKKALAEPRRQLGKVVRLAADRRAWSRSISRFAIAVAERDTPQTPLIAAARGGDVAMVQALLAAGAEADVQGAHGRTALFEAVLHSNVEVAACLLAWGADPTLTDLHGRAPLELGFVTPETLHAIRQRYHRWPSPHTPQPLLCEPEATWVTRLERDGIVKISGLIAADELARMQSDVQRFVAQLEAKLAHGQGVYQHYDEEEHFWAADCAYVTNNAFKHSRDFVRLCRRADLAQAASVYLGKPAFIQRGLAMRYLPSPSSDNDMFGWHHDMDEKRFKVMVLLSDVGKTDQHMSYVLGSHRVFHPYRMFFENQCRLEYCRAQLDKIEIYDAIGAAGDLIVFDSNGAHRGNRRTTAPVRDVLLVEYTADKSEIWGGDIDPALRQQLTGPNDPFARLVAARKKWTLPSTRRLPMWVENLPHIERWLLSMGDAQV